MKGEREFDQSLVRERFDYNESTGELIWKNCFRRGQIGSVAGYINGGKGAGYRFIWLNGKARLAHRLIWLWHFGTSPENIDHINGNRSDNRLSNLRVATRQENIRNQKKQSNTSSQFKGVWLEDGSWRAGIRVNGKTVHLGSHTCEQDAALAYNAAARAHFWEFAKLNETRQL